MNGTPRLRSSYPSTPDTQKQRTSQGSNLGGGGLRRTLPTVPTTAPTSRQAGQPVIPLHIIDAPSQRLYATAFYLALLAYRLYDWSRLVEDEAESFWLFIKWVGIDGIFLYGLPELHIPWLEWSSTVTTTIFLAHAVINGMLMFRVPVS